MSERLLNRKNVRYEIQDDEWSVSRFNVRTRSEDGTLLLYNSYTGAMGGVPQEFEEEALHILQHGVSGELSDFARDLAANGILVKKGTNEFRRAEMMRREVNRTDHLHLILMPSEECNFRCVYCYESFPRGRMHPDVVEGIKKMIADKLQTTKVLAISWFGGEPLSEADLLLEITDSFLPYVKEHEIDYTSVVTTNGYYLTPELCKELVSRGIRTFNVTLDGLKEDHDLTRILKGGGDTFETILNNLKALKETDLPFKILIRSNFHPKTNIDAFVEYLSQEFAGDNRFHVYFRPVGRWGGENDDNLVVCEGKQATKLMLEADLKAVQANLPVTFLQDFLQPMGTMCYAAKPNSFVIGSDGTLYKCTVALDSDFNRIGKIHKDGSMDIDYDKMALWVLGGADEDTTCQKCFFRPSCHGSACPLVRLESGERPCPSEKEAIKDVLKVLWEMEKRLPHVISEPAVL